ncbi:MAG: hypothetical protein AAB254_06270, partial [candidate division NC10 bacterium]
FADLVKRGFVLAVDELPKTLEKGRDFRGRAKPLEPLPDIPLRLGRGFSGTCDFGILELLDALS